MGVGRNFGEAFGKAQDAAGMTLPTHGNVFISVLDEDKASIIDIARDLQELGFSLFASRGTAEIIQKNGVSCTQVNKVREGRPNIIDKIKNDDIDFIINTTEHKQTVADYYHMRGYTLRHKITYTTTLAGARAAILALKSGTIHQVNCLQALHADL